MRIKEVSQSHVMPSLTDTNTRSPEVRRKTQSKQKLNQVNLSTEIPTLLIEPHQQEDTSACFV